MNEGSGGKKVLLGILFFLLAVIVFGLFWFFKENTGTPQGPWWFLFSFAAGLTMIVLPCTLPLAFVIVPLSMGKGPMKGLAIALAFGIGVSITLSLYGVIGAAIGKVAFAGLGADIEVVKNWLYFIAGILAYGFALGQLGLVRFTMPTYTGAFPDFIQKQQDILKALLLGLFLGNIGIGCPHPATPFIFTEIVSSGNIMYGWLLFLVHAIGRVLPLLFLAILGILGVNALAGLVSRKDKIERATGWGMVFVAAFILILGLFSHDWWVLSGMHTYLEELTQEERFLGIAADRIGTETVHDHGMPAADRTGLFGLPLPWGTWVLLALWITPLFWMYFRKRKDIAALPEAERAVQSRTLPYFFWQSVTLTLLLTLTFGYVLPKRFAEQSMQGHDAMPGEHMTDAAGDMGHAGHAAMLHEAGDVEVGPVVEMTAVPGVPSVGQPAALDFFVNFRPDRKPIPAEELALEHEKKMHVIGMRTDLTDFFHIHPVPATELFEKTPLNSSHFLQEYTFPNPGEYKIWSEIKYDGMNHALGQPLLRVEGEGETFRLEKDAGMSRIVDRYQVTLHYDELYPGYEGELHFSIKDAFGRTAPLSDYLGAPMHLAIVSEDLKEFIHAHPEEAGGAHGHSGLVPVAMAAGEHEGGHEDDPDAVAFHVTLPRAGSYKAFAQFAPQEWERTDPDQYLLAEFWIQAVEGAPVSPAVNLVNSWWLRLGVSILLIALLSWRVKRYISLPDNWSPVKK